MLSLRYILKVIEYKKNSQLSREQMLQVQKKNWLKLLKHISKKSPYYSELIQKINLPLEEITPKHFPVLTQADLNTNFDRIVTDPKVKLEEIIHHANTHTPDQLYLNRYHILKTSGTTGIPNHFISTPKDVIDSITPSVARSPNLKRDNSNLKRNTGKKRICMLGLENSYCSSSQNLNVSRSLWITKKVVDYKLIPMNQPLDQVIQILNEFQPHVLAGYAKLLLILADAQRAGKLKISPQSIDSGGEPLLHTDRKYLKDVFNCNINNHYGSTEGYSMGISRDGENSMELFEDHLIFEIEENKAYITNLHNYTLPLVRFQMNDVLIPIKEQTFSPFLKVECGVGRPAGIPYFTTQENGQITVQPIELDPLMPTGVKAFALSRDKINSVEYTIFIDEKYKNQVKSIKEKTLQVLREFFDNKGGKSLQIEVVIGEDYKINPVSLKTQLWQGSKVTSPTSAPHATV